MLQFVTNNFLYVFIKSLGGKTVVCKKLELKKENNCLLSFVGSQNIQYFSPSLRALKLVEGQIEAVNCVCGRQLFEPFSDKIPVFCVLTSRTLRLLPVTRSAPRQGEGWDLEGQDTVWRGYGTDGTLGQEESICGVLAYKGKGETNVDGICHQMGVHISSIGHKCESRYSYRRKGDAPALPSTTNSYVTA